MFGTDVIVGFYEQASKDTDAKYGKHYCTANTDY
jgi:hypothetical protein